MPSSLIGTHIVIAECLFSSAGDDNIAVVDEITLLWIFHTIFIFFCFLHIINKLRCSMTLPSAINHPATIVLYQCATYFMEVKVNVITGRRFCFNFVLGLGTWTNYRLLIFVPRHRSVLFRDTLPNAATVLIMYILQSPFTTCWFVDIAACLHFTRRKARGPRVSVYCTS